VISFLIPAAALFLFLGVYPTIRMVYTSLTDWNLTRPWEPQKFNAGQHYLRLVTDVRFWNAAGRTLIIISTSVFATLVLGFGIALLLNELNYGRNTLRMLFIGPMLIAPSIVGLVFRFILNYDFGMVNQILAAVKLPRINFLGTPRSALFSVILVDTWQWTPFAMLVLLAALENLPQELFEAAKVDGATGLQILRFVTLPLMRPFFFIVALFRFIQCLRLYDVIKLMTDGGPGVGTEIINVYITRVGFTWFDMGYACALAFVTLNLAALVTALFFRYVKVFEEIRRY